jgi:hypothetical protein
MIQIAYDPIYAHGRVGQNVSCLFNAKVQGWLQMGLQPIILV